MRRIRVFGVMAVLAALAALAGSTRSFAAATKTFTSTSCGYSVRYPAGWQLVHEKTDTLFGQPAYNVRISCTHDPKATVSAWLRVVKPRFTRDGFHVVSATSRPNLEVLDVAAKGEVDRFVATTHRGTLYIFHYAASSRAVFNAHVSTFKAMVGSVSFK